MHELRFAEAARILRALPSPLPPAPAFLTPQRAPASAGGRASPGDTGARRAGALIPDSSRLAEAAFRPSAVLVLIFPDEPGEARVLLTARPEADMRHAGQVSFPGGATDEADADPAGTALREAREEVGLQATAEEIEVVGTLDPVSIPVSGFRLTPVLALAPRRPTLSPDAREVSAVFDAPVERFLPGAPVSTVERIVDDRIGSGPLRIRYAAFEYEGYEIWGATARILGQLGAILAKDGRSDDRPRVIS